jgi:hypothetical protein
MSTTRWLLSMLLFTSLVSVAQVGDIKSASKENSSNSGSSSSDRGNSGGGGNVFFFFDMFRVFGVWQMHVLEKRPDVPQIVSLDIMLHGAVQPSSYYIFNPRVRGTWGILSSDFRTNYMVEQTIEGNADLTTIDWQIVQLNFVNTRNVIARAGAGFMQENFGDHMSFFESTISSNLMFDDNQWGGFIEWRSAKDFETQAVPRREFNLQVQKQVFEAGALHGMVTAGLQFQRYYSQINVWGMQGGFILKLY